MILFSSDKYIFLDLSTKKPLIDLKPVDRLNNIKKPLVKEGYGLSRFSGKPSNFTG